MSKLQPLVGKSHRRLGRRVYCALIGLVSVQLIAMPALALADGTWLGTGPDGLWNDSANWVGGTIPGATSGTTNADIATFNTSLTPPTGQNTVTIDSGRNLGGLTFDTSAGAFTIGGAGANGGNALLLSSGGTTQITSGLSGSGIVETLNAPIVLEPASGSSAGTYTFANNASAATSVFKVAGGISGGATTSPVTLNLDGSNTGANTISGAISNGSAASLAVAKIGSGTWTLSGPNSFTGGVSVSGGTLVTTADNNLGAASNSITLSNGGAWSLGGGINGSNTHAIILGTGGGTLSPQGDTRFTGTISGGTGLTVNSGDFLPAPSAAANIGTLTITGSGTRVLTGFGAGGNNNFVANNTVVVTNGGNLDFGQGGTYSPTNTMSFASGTSLGSRGTTVNVNTANVTFPSAGTMIFQNDDTGNSGLMTVNGNYPTLTGPLTLQVGSGGTISGNLDMNGIISGGFGLTKTGPATLILAGNNNYSGGTTISTGTLQIGNGTTAGAVGSGAILNNSALSFNAPAAGQTVANDISGSGSINQIGGTTTISGNITSNGAVTASGGTLQLGTATVLQNSSPQLNGGTLGFSSGIGTFTVAGLGGSTGLNLADTSAAPVNLQIGNNNASSNYSGAFSGGGSVTKIGSGTLTLSGPSTFTGGLTVAQGNVSTGTVNNAGSSGPLGQAAGGVTLGATGTTGTLEYTGASAASNMPFTLASGGTGNFQVDQAGTNLALSGNIGGGGGLSKSGLGTLTLSTASGYTGSTTLNSGTLALAFSNSVSSNILNSNTALTLNSGTLSITGAPTGSTNQTIASLAVGSAASNIVINPGTGTGTTLTITSPTVTTGAGTLNFNTSAGTPSTAVIAWNPTLTSGIIGGAYTITDNTGTGFATVVNGDVVRFTATTDLTTNNANSGTGSTNFSTAPATDGQYTANVLTLTSAPPYATGSLAIDAGPSGSSNTLNLNGGTMTFASNGLAMSDAGNFTISNGQLGASNAPLLISQLGTGTLNIASSISGGSGSLTTGGTGTVVLSGSSSFTGGTTIASGTTSVATLSNANTNGPLGHVGSVTLGGASTSGTLEYTGGTGASNMPLAMAAGGGSLQVDLAATNLTMSGALSGAGAFTKTGAGALTLATNNNGFTGPLTVAGGTLVTSGDGNLNASGSTFTISNGATWQATGGTNHNIVLGPGGGTMKLSGDFLTNGVITGGTGLTVIGGDMLPNMNSQDNLGSLTLNGNSATVATIGRILMLGSGGNTNFLGSASVHVTNGGNLSFGQGGSEAPTNTMVFDTNTGLSTRNTALTVNTANVTFPSAGLMVFNWDDTGSTTGITVNGNYPTLTGDLTIQVGGGSATGNTNLTGVLSGSFDLTKTGANQLVLSGANTLSGTTTISAGTILLNNANALQDSTVSIGVANGLTFNTGINTFTLGGLAGASNDVLTNVSTLNVGNGGHTSNYSGALSGNAAYTEVGAGTQTLSGQNTYTGATTVSSGTLIAGTNAPSGSAGAFGNATSAITLGNAGTTTNNSSPSLLIGGAFNVARPVTIANQATSGTYTIGGSTDNNATFSGPISINQPLTVSQVANTGTNALNITGGISAASAGTRTVTFAGPGNVNVSTTGITDGAGMVAVNVPNGTTTFAVANGYTGATTVSGGTLNLGVDNAIGSGSSVAVSAGTLGIGTFNDTVAGVQLTGGSITGTTGVLTSNSTYDVQNGSISAILAGSNGLTKSTSGTVILAAANSYIGTTNVNAGVLRVNGSLSSGAPVIVNAGGTISGHGTIGGTLTVGAGGTLGLGDAANLTVGGLVLSDKSTMTYNLDIPNVTHQAYNPVNGNDLTTVTNFNGLALSPNSYSAGSQGTMVNIIAGGNFAAGAYELLAYSGSFSGSLSSFGIGSAPAGHLYEFVNVPGNGGGQIDLLVVPEPSSLVLLGLGLAGLACGWRRRRAKSTQGR